MEKQYGYIVKPDCLVLKNPVGNATMVNDGSSYDVEIFFSVNRWAPVVSCTQTGKTFVLPWEDILHLAAAAGLLDHQRATTGPEG